MAKIRQLRKMKSGTKKALAGKPKKASEVMIAHHVSNGGTVTVSMEMKVGSAHQYSSAGYGVAATVPLGKASLEQTLERAQAEVARFFFPTAGETLASLDNKIGDIKADRR